MSRDDCPICQDGQHYVPQGCIRALVAKVQALTARVEELELGHALPVIDEGATYNPSSLLPIDGKLTFMQSVDVACAKDQSSPSVTLDSQPLMAHEPHKVTRSEQMKEVWRQRRAAKV